MILWIAGCNGLVGSALRKNHPQALATSHTEVDISSSEQVKKFVDTCAITHIINCAAYTNVDQAEKEPHLAHATNAVGPENLGRVAAQNKIHLLHISTDYVFDGKKQAPYTETDPCSPINVYGKTKYEGEQRLLATHPDACIVRTSWVFGPGGKTFVSTLLEKQSPISVVSDQVNRLTYVFDLAKALVFLLPHSGIFHFANRGATSRYEIAKKLLPHKIVTPVSSSTFFHAAPRPLYSVLDTTKIEKLGLQPRPWQEAIEEFLHEM